MVRMVAFGSLIILVLLSARVASFQSVNGIQRSKNAGRFTRLVAPPQPSRYLWPFNRLKPMSRRTFSSIDSYMEDSPFLEEEFDVNEMGAWVPVGSISCLSGLDPLDMEIMGRKFVVWRSSSQGQWSVLVDECSHRMAPLSQGRINRRTKCLECPYHGWAFDRNGTLQVIPQLEAGASLHAEQRSVESFPVHITGDLLWTFLPTSFHGEAFPKSLLPETWYSGLKDIVDQGTTFYTQDLPFSFDFFVENVLDGPSHAHFAHHGYGFDRSEAGPIPCKIVISNFTELSTEVTYKRQGIMRHRRYGYQRPFYLTNKQPVAEDWKTAIVFLAVPVREGCTRLITTFETLRPHKATPDWLLHIINQKFLEGDLIVHGIEVLLRKRQSPVPKYIHATSSDASCRAWRTWWQRYGLSAAPPNTFGPASPENLQLLDRKELTNPWRMHTSKCAKCQKALRRCKLFRKLGFVLAWSSLAFLRKRTIVPSIFLAVTACTLSLLSMMAGRALEGPMSNGDEVEKTFEPLLDLIMS